MITDMDCLFFSYFLQSILYIEYLIAFVFVCFWIRYISYRWLFEVHSIRLEYV